MNSNIMVVFSSNKPKIYCKISMTLICLRGSVKPYYVFMIYAHYLNYKLIVIFNLFYQNTKKIMLNYYCIHFKLKIESLRLTFN